ncbi:hypothetical protein SAMN05216525_13279 [Bradyrhizobium sp. Gha]|nr:hypothetical protein SAMN05216525_13279 [Bradyrhizobium sp. Gha]
MLIFGVGIDAIITAKVAVDGASAGIAGPDF